MPPAARIGDLHVCVVHPPVPMPIVAGAKAVNIGYQPAARVTDKSACPAQALIATGSPNVIIEGQPAARLGDATAPPGLVVTGCPTVNIGSTPQIEALILAAALGIPFLDQDCKLCESPTGS
jgi:uncharacterized Zn-binding protein involved in type VI secretion